MDSIKNQTSCDSFELNPTVSQCALRPSLGCPIALAMLTCLQLSVCTAAESYRVIKEIPVTGSGPAHIALDEATHRLYVAREDKIVIVDLEKDSVVGEIAGTPGVCGFLPASKFGFGYSINAKENKLNMIHLTTLETPSKMPAGEGPVSIIYSPHKEELYVFSRNSRSASYYEADDGDLMGSIQLAGTPASGVADPNARVFCTLEDKNEIAVINTDKHSVLSRWPVAPAKKPAAIAIDAANHRLFVACSENTLLLVDASSGKVITTLTVEGGLDALAFDPSGKVLACAGGQALTLFHLDSPDKLSAQQTLKSENGKQSDVAIDSKAHRIYTTKATPDAVKVMVYGL